MAPKKKQKTEADAAVEGEAAMVVEATVPEVEAELKAELAQNEAEKDAANDKRKKMGQAVCFLGPDTTANVMSSTVGNMLMAVKDNGLTHLCAGARGSVGVKTGRYAFEVKVVESFGPADGQPKAGQAPKSILRVGFSTRSSDLFLGDGADNICFDEAGALVYNQGPLVPSGPRKNAPMFSAHASVVVVLNLDDKSPNANTISLFHDGKRLSKPEPLPDALKGQVLYPTISFRSCTVNYNFDEDLQPALPFKCRMLGDAAAADVVVTEATKKELEVLFPVFLPDKGTFDWADYFLKENAGRYSELSDRAILDWGVRSGVKNTKAASKKSTGDKPDMGLGVKELDDGSVKDLLASMAPLQERSYVIMEVKGNLLKEDRMAALKKWRHGPFKKVAQVMMGKPDEGFRKKVAEYLLAEKQAKIDKAFETQKLEKAKKKAAVLAAKKVQASMRKAEKLRKKMEEDKKRKMAEEVKKQEEEQAAAEKEASDALKAEAEASGEAKEEEGKETADEVKKEEEKAPEEAKAEEPEKEEEEEENEKMEEEEEEDNEKPEVATLTPVELQTWFRKRPLADLSEEVVTKAFGKASLPEESEGFDEVRFAWSTSEECAQEMKRWVSERKLSTKIEDLQPSEWFKEKFERWQKDLQAWHVKHMEFKDPAKPKKGGDPSMSKAAPQKPPSGLDTSPQKDDAKKEEKDAKDEQDIDDGKDPIQALEEELDREEVDIFGIENICEMDSEGTPLFKDFAFEDWALLSLRFELHLLVHSFRHDANDPERTGIHPEHLAFYYNRYYKKALNSKNYGVESVDELLELVKDTVLADSKSKVAESMVTDDLETNEIFVKLTEENRRDRSRRVDAGDESAKLKFSRPLAGGANSMSASAPPVAGMSKAGAMAKSAGLGQTAKAAGPQPMPKFAQPAWGAQPQMGKGMGGARPWGAMGKGGMGMGMGGGQWNNNFFGGNQWQGGW